MTSDDACAHGVFEDDGDCAECYLESCERNACEAELARITAEVRRRYVHPRPESPWADTTEDYWRGYTDALGELFRWLGGDPTVVQP